MVDQGAFWENIYGDKQQLNLYPYDSVVSFVYRNYPRSKARKDVHILELGCGAGNNLWFAAREGFSVTGIDISDSAIQFAKDRFTKEGLSGHFIVGDFSEVLTLGQKFDLVIERVALPYIGFSKCKTLFDSLPSILHDNGKVFINVYSDKHSSCASGVYNSDGVTVNISHILNGPADTHFFNRREIYQLFENGYEIEQLKHLDIVESLLPSQYNAAEWQVIARKL